MHVSGRVTKPRESLTIRVDAELNDLIEHAAKLVGVKRTDFILDAARRAAQDLLLERPSLTLSPEAYREFVVRLNARPRPNKRLIKSMRTAAPRE